MTDEGGMQDVATTQEPTSPTHSAGGINVRGVQVYEREQLPYAGCFLSGIILLVALLSKRDELKSDKYYSYGISIAVVAMVFSLAGWIMSRAGNVVFLQYNNYFLFVWNFVGACFMTFGSPFDATGNGYFASWGIALFAIMGLGVTADRIKEGAENMGPLVGVLAASIITFVAICSEGFNNDYKGELIYAIVVAALSILVCAYMIVLAQPASIINMPVLAVFSLLWIVAASLVTFRGPFFLTGNGYFASWAAAFASVFATFHAGGGGGGGGQEGAAADDTI